ncbi:MAG: DNA cytosine methyltransferase, partial [Herbinix sp.]|nr:DNA cytosine methyltransferase [Herbinix sp.]
MGCYGFHQAGFKCIATNEIINRRLNIQRYNHKCERESGYICGDITQKKTKDLIANEVNWWKNNKGIQEPTVVVATPPCQGMSVVNHKKNDKDIERNSLVIESLKMIMMLRPLFFVFENVPAFMDTACVMENGEVVSIREAHHRILGNDYLFYDDVLNFKLYGSKSSRTRTLVIGVSKKLARFISPIELFPDRESETTLFNVIGHLPPLTEMGEINPFDIYHSFRVYPEYMLPWISGLGEGESAFDNTDADKRPYKFTKDGKRVENANKTGDKYRRQVWNHVAPSVHTRNDQLASQNTIHPRDNRVFSIRELMLMMTIPDDFKWDSKDLLTLNAMSPEKKRSFLKKEETNIRQCIGEAVPTHIFYKVAVNIMRFMESQRIVDQQIRNIIKKKNLQITDNLLNFINENIKIGENGQRIQSINNATLSRISELANTLRIDNAAYYTEKETLTYIFEHLPYIDSESIHILEPSVGTGNFIPFLVKKYSYAKELIIDAIDIDGSVLKIAEQLWQAHLFPENVKINILCADYLETDISAKHYNLVIGNPPYIKVYASRRLEKYRKDFEDDLANNLAAFFIEKSCMYADYVGFILPKNFLCNIEYSACRAKLYKKRIESVVDFGEHGFSGINIETIFLLVNTNRKGGNVLVESIPRSIRIVQNQRYICGAALPTWVIYRDSAFDKTLSEKRFGVFDVYRDRQITKSMSVKRSTVWIIKSKNIPRDGKSLVHIDGGKGDLRLNRSVLKNLGVYEYIDRDDVFLVPNMTYYPRMIKKPSGVVPNGSVAILIPKEAITVSDQ